MSAGSGTNYSFKSLPFHEDEESGIKLVPDSYLDSMDDYNDDDEQYGRRISEPSEDEGRVSVLTIDELKNMRKKNKNEEFGLKQSFPKNKKNINYNSNAFKNSYER